jgi:hypothetical protein
MWQQTREQKRYIRENSAIEIRQQQERLPTMRAFSVSGPTSCSSGTKRFHDGFKLLLTGLEEYLTEDLIHPVKCRTASEYTLMQAVGSLKALPFRSPNFKARALAAPLTFILLIFR